MFCFAASVLSPPFYTPNSAAFIGVGAKVVLPPAQGILLRH